MFLAFYGGRTNATKLYHKVKTCRNQPIEKIHYVDVCSLYPFVNKYGLYPVGHPKIYTENFKEISSTEHPYEGLIKCHILPPSNLFHPVLPHRSRGKLTFPLCRSCADYCQSMPCNHDESDRVLIGTWVSAEIYKAIDKGYKVKLYIF